MTDMATLDMTTISNAISLSRRQIPERRQKMLQPKNALLESEVWKFARTRHELLIDWSRIEANSAHSIRAGFAQVAELCDEAGKDEFVVENIASRYQVGRDDPAMVIEAQDRIVSLFREAIEKQNRKMPEFRLSLRRGSFDIRFYLGRTRPTDFCAPDENL